MESISIINGAVNEWEQILRVFYMECIQFSGMTEKNRPYY